MPYFVPNIPTSQEEGGYQRIPTVFYWTTRPIQWTWVFQVGYMGSYPAIRMLVDGQPVTDWVNRNAKNKYVFNFDVPDGHHIADFEGCDQEVIRKAFVVNTTGAPLPLQNPWASTKVLELTANRAANGVAQVVYPGVLPEPKMFPLKPRTPEPFNTLPDNFTLSKSLWARRFQANAPNGITTRRFVSIPTGDVVIEDDQKYATLVTIAKIETPNITLRDGPRGVGALGYIYKLIPNPGGLGFYYCDVMGRMGFLWNDGRVVTLAGWRIKPGELKAHLGVRATNRAFYDSKWETVGDWSQVPEPKNFFEPWGFAAFGGHHEFWICDTRNNRILYVNHYTAHSQASYAQPTHPPIGYVAPAEPTGQSQLFQFLGASDFVKEPWDCEIQGEYLYWTNFAGNSICRARLDGSNPEYVVNSSVQPTDADLGIPQRLYNGAHQDTLRPLYLKDGPVGEASCVRPEGIAFDSLGRLTWVERYTFALRRLEGGIVTTIALLPYLYEARDMSLLIDTEGSFGPKDDYFIQNWLHHLRFSSTGERRQYPFGYIADQTIVNGMVTNCVYPSYGWAWGIHKGRMIWQGSAGQWQAIEITKKQATDPTFDIAKYMRGFRAFNHEGKMFLTHGPNGQGELGLPTIDEMGSWDDQTIRDYATQYGVTSLEDFLYWVRCMTCDQDYSGLVTLQAPMMLMAQAIDVE